MEAHTESPLMEARPPLPFVEAHPHQPVAEAQPQSPVMDFMDDIDRYVMQVKEFRLHHHRAITGEATGEEILLWIDGAQRCITNMDERLTRILRVSTKQKLQSAIGHLESIKRKLESYLKYGSGLARSNVHESIVWDDVQSAFNNRIKSGVISNLSYVDAGEFLDNAKDLFMNHKQLVQRHEPLSVAYYLKCSYDDSLSRFASYRQLHPEDISPAKWFINELQEIAFQVDKIFKNPKSMDLSQDEQDEFDKADTCHICRKKIDNPNDKVRDHCHLTGVYRGLRNNDESVEHAPLEPEAEGLVDAPPLNNEVIEATMPNDPHLIDAIRVFQQPNSIEEEELLSMALDCEPRDEGLVNSQPLNHEVTEATTPHDSHLIDAVKAFQQPNSIEEDELLSLALDCAEVEWEPPSKSSVENQTIASAAPEHSPGEHQQQHLQRVTRGRRLEYPDDQEQPRADGNYSETIYTFSKALKLTPNKMDLSAINKAATVVTKKLKELESGKIYTVTTLSPVWTRFGNRVIAELNAEFQVFLPKRLSETLVQEQATLSLMQAAATAGTLKLKFINTFTMEFIHEA
ncbi:hypothetical protein QAD02_016918 [Eretmocerus hayati]|uniref:Uncharacterized protein n=1 Tax=Eretmocerus hayati TaxID=131215 RepID=A0ACC2PE88_9HYME|nr:hypothetical protein QAD02_016918 [Eretmocerus hayati]